MSAQPNSRRTREQQRAHYRTMLVVAMHGLLDRKSYADITVDDILAESGVARATYYTNFKSKSELLIAVAENLYTDALDVTEPWWKLPPDATRSDLMDALRNIFDLYLPNKSTMAALLEASAYEARVQEQVRYLQRGSIIQLERHIRAGQQAGSVRKNLYPKQTAGWIIWMVERGMYQMATYASPEEQRRLLSSLTDVVWHTLYGLEGRE